MWIGKSAINSWLKYAHKILMTSLFCTCFRVKFSFGKTGVKTLNFRKRRSNRWNSFMRKNKCGKRRRESMFTCTVLRYFSIKFQSIKPLPCFRNLILRCWNCLAKCMKKVCTIRWFIFAQNLSFELEVPKNWSNLKATITLKKFRLIFYQKVSTKTQ